MSAIKEVSPGRLEIREGGGCLTLFGLPFLATGIFMMLASFGVVTMHNDGEPVTQVTLLLLAVLFTLVGAVLSFGRSITAIDVGQHVVTKQWRVLLPVRMWTYQLGDYSTVTLAFVRGDSDSADKYPIGLKGNSVAPLPLCSPTQYAEAHQCAAAVAIGMLGWLGFLSSPRPLALIEWIFVVLFFAGFGVLPAASVVARWLRSRVGRTIVTVSTEELRVQERGIFRTRTVAVFQATEILDLDYSSKESMILSARRSAEAETSTMRKIPSSASNAGPSTEWVFTVLGRFLKGKGIVVKTRKGLTTFGEGLADDEIQYLHAIVRRALTGTAG